MKNEIGFKLYMDGVFFGIIWFETNEVKQFLVKRGRVFVGVFNCEAVYMPLTVIGGVQ